MVDAKKLILENLESKNPYLNLGNCGLDGTGLRQAGRDI